MLKVVDGDTSTNEVGSSGGPLRDEIAREGARRMLAAASEAEVAAYIEAHVDHMDAEGHRLVVRNVASRAQMMTATGCGNEKQAA